METADEAGNAGNPATLTVPTPAIGVQIPQQIGTASTYRLTSRDVEQAFKFFSSASDGGRTVSKQDVHKRLDGLFHNLSSEEHRILFGTKAFVPGNRAVKSAGQERAQSAGTNANSVTIETIERVLGIPEHRKGENVESTREFQNTVDDIFKLFDIDPNGNISEHMLKSIIQNYNNTAPDGIGRQESAGVARSTNDNNDSERVQLKFDKFALLKKFDRDEDGGIGREDFIRVPEKQKLFTSPAAMINNVLQAFMQVKKH